VRLVTLGLSNGWPIRAGWVFAPVNIDPYEFIRGDIGQSWMESSDKPYRLAIGFSRAAGAVIEGLNDDALAACRGYESSLVQRTPFHFRSHDRRGAGHPGYSHLSGPVPPDRVIFRRSSPLRSACTAAP